MSENQEHSHARGSESASHYNIQAPQGVVIGDHVVVEQHFHAAPLPPLDTPQAEPAPGQPPYMGLRYFDVGDAALFYGREALVQQLAGRLVEERFLAIIGASGSGKSSVARAGLVTAWQQGLPGPASPCGPVHLITPTAHPLESLAASLTRASESVTATATLIDDLARDARSLHLYARKLLSGDRRAAGAAGSHLLLVVDQFEETFTLCKNPDERRAFVDNLLAAASDENAGPLRVVITLRADFYHRCAEYPGLPQALQAHQAYITAMSCDELRQAITAPALAAGWELEQGLVELILQEVGDEPGALPLLSHALLETWRRRQGRRLTLAGYAAAGGVRKAIAQTAERVYGGLSEAEQAIARRIFLRLTELGEGVQDTRRRSRLDELAPVPEQAAAVQAVLHTLADARLVTTDQDGAEVTHEALIREWPALRRWLGENREDLRLHRRLTENALEWKAGAGEDLYRGARLAQARELAERHPTWLNPIEQDFLAASLAEAQRSEAELEAHRQRELEQARRLAQTQRQRSLVLGAGLALATLLALLAMFWFSRSQHSLASANTASTQSAASAATAQAERQIAEAERQAAEIARQAAEAERLRAERQSHIALGRQLAAQAQSFYRALDARQTIALLLAAQSMRISPSVEAGQVLQGSTLARPILHMRHDDRVSAVAFSPDGRYVVSGSWDNTARVWAIGNGLAGQEIARLKHGGPVSALAFSPDGRYLVSASADKTTRVWAVPSAAESGRWQEITRLTHPAGVLAAAFSRDGRFMLLVDPVDSAWVYATGSWQEIARLKHSGPVTALAYSPDGRYVASGSADGTARIWAVSSQAETAGWEEVARLEHAGKVYGVTFSPDGRYVVSGSADRAARVWDVSRLSERASGEAANLAVVEVARLPHVADVTTVGFNPDGSYVLTGCADGIARVWAVGSWAEIARISTGGTVITSAFSPDGRYVLSTGADGTARIWENSTLSEFARLTHAAPVTVAAFSPDARYIVTGGEDHGVRVWATQGGKELTRQDHAGPVFALAYSPDGRYAASGGTDGTAQVWRVSTGPAESELEIARMRHAGPVIALAFSPDGRYILSGSADGIARIWEAAGGSASREGARLEHVLAVSAVYRAAVIFSPDGRYVASGGEDGTARIWQLAGAAGAAREIARLAHAGPVTALAFSPNGRYVLSGSEDDTARVWVIPNHVETGNWEELARVDHEGDVLCVAFSPDGRYAVSAGEDGTAWVWEAAGSPGTGSGAAIRLLPGSPVTAAAFSPDGRSIALGGRDGVVSVWETATGMEVARLPHDGWITTVAFSPDGRYVLSGSYDGAARVWELPSLPERTRPRTAGSAATEIARLDHGSPVTMALFSPDGRYVLSGSKDHTARVWYWRPEDWVAHICTFLPRNLTRAEWQQYIGEALPYQATCPRLPVEPEPTPAP